MAQVKYGIPVPTLRDPNPSPEDIALTRRIVQAGKLVEIDVLDHLIIGHNRFVSLRERALGFEDA